MRRFLLLLVLFSSFLPELCQSPGVPEQQPIHTPRSLVGEIKQLVHNNPLQHALYGIVASEATLCLSKMLSSFVAATIPSAFVLQSPLMAAAVMRPACCVITTANLIVYALWQKAKHEGDLRFYRAMYQLFVVPYDEEERRRRPLSILLSAFSHLEFLHLSRCLLGLHCLGDELEQFMGSRKFIYFYVSSIYASKFINFGFFHKIDHFLERVYGSELSIFRRIDLFMEALTELIQVDLPHHFRHQKRKLGRVGAMGASGALSALLANYSLHFPESEFIFYGGIFILPARMATLVWFFEDFLLQGRTNTGHGAHLRGYIFRALIWALEKWFLVGHEELEYNPERTLPMKLSGGRHEGTEKCGHSILLQQSKI